MSNAISILTSLAESLFREKPGPAADSGPAWFEPWTSDRVLAESQKVGALFLGRDPEIDSYIQQIFAEPGLERFRTLPGQLDPMILHPGGGMRTSAAGLVTGLFGSAYLQMYFLRIASDEKIFVRTVLENFERVRYAAKGEKVSAYLVLGFAGVTLPEGTEITTPWGTVKAAPKPRAQAGYTDPWRPQTTSLLVQRVSLPIKVDRAAAPSADFGNFDFGIAKSQVLFPLTCALASKESGDPAVPINTWWSLLLPFQMGMSYSQSLTMPRLKSEASIGDPVEVEKWARILDDSHAASMDVAARRIISASGQRVDRSDALIDAVTVWENLVGTGTEVTFRVTAAISKALESDPTKRKPLQKRLAEIYRVRSAVVHGDIVEARKLDDAAKDAIDVGVQLLRFCYTKGGAWLAMKSFERADSLLLEEP
jgi:Apea-like HEPN